MILVTHLLIYCTSSCPSRRGSRVVGDMFDELADKAYNLSKSWLSASVASLNMRKGNITFSATVMLSNKALP